MTEPVLFWRIGTDTPGYLADDLTGDGAKITGGRWNRIGIPMLYASSSRALACLETLVHLGVTPALPLNRYLVELSVPAAAWKKRRLLVPADHVGWDSEPAGKISLDWGTSWASERATLVAEVPSVVVPEESNILINPAHGDIASVAARKVRRWSYDARLNLNLRRVK